MSDNFHKQAVLKKRRIVNLSLTGLYKQEDATERTLQRRGWGTD